MKKIILCTLLFSSVVVNTVFSADYYISPTGSDSSGDGSISSPWFSIDIALNKYRNDGVNSRVGPGDTLYMRGGVYDVTAMTLNDGATNRIQTNTNALTSAITVMSFPGEWAIFDGGNATDSNTGRRIMGTNSPNYNIIFQNFEMRYARTTAINSYEMGNNNPSFIGCVFKNLYIHGCKDTNVDANPSGMRLDMQDSVIEYCKFYDNGTTGSAHHNNANLILYNSYQNAEGEEETATQARKSNVIRYNVFDGAGTGIKDKGDSNFVTTSSPDESNAIWANDIHHNIITNTRGDAYYSVQDFVKFHHNLILNCNNGVRLHAPAETTKSMWWNEIYNNTFVNMKSWAIAVETESSSASSPLNHTIKNNLFYNATSAALLFWTGQSAYRASVTSDHNVWDDDFSTIGRRESNPVASLSTWQSYGYDTNSSIGAVAFVDATSKDFRLAQGSAGVNNADDGGNVGAFTDINWYQQAGYYGVGKAANSTNAPQVQNLIIKKM